MLSCFGLCHCSAISLESDRNTILLTKQEMFHWENSLRGLLRYKIFNKSSLKVGLKFKTTRKIVGASIHFKTEFNSLEWEFLATFLYYRKDLWCSLQRLRVSLKPCWFLQYRLYFSMEKFRVLQLWNLSIHFNLFSGKVCLICFWHYSSSTLWKYNWGNGSIQDYFQSNGHMSLKLD